jgi:Circadian oscillating protein COP23
MSQQQHLLSNSNIARAILLATLAITTAFTTEANSQSIAQSDPSTLQFSCGKAQDLSSNSNLPATVVKVSGSTEEQVLIIWKSERFVKYTPQQRCEIVSPKFQAALQQGRNYLSAGIDKKGVGIICATANAEQACDRNSMLFTLKSYQDADTTIKDIADIFAGGKVGPGYQGSGSKQVIDLRNFALLRKK